jgi:hypothetical protein
VSLTAEPAQAVASAACRRLPIRAWPALMTAAATGAITGPVAAQPAGEPSVGRMHPYLTVRGDTLIGLGRRFLVDPGRWPAIARANRLRNPDLIPTGAVLLIPLDLMRTEPLPATVLGVVGDARVDGRALEAGSAGQPLDEGSQVQTGADGHLSVRLIDGSLLRLRPGSRLSLPTSRRIVGTPAVRTDARLDDGRVEVEAAPARDGRPGFEIRTPQGVLAVRGTEFRVGAQDGRSRGEVLGGVVLARGAGDRRGEAVAAGYGTLLDGAGHVAPPVRLLPPPDLSAIPALHEQILVSLPLPPLGEAQAWRLQIARRGSFDAVLADLRTRELVVRVPGLPDDDYVLRLRAVDARGLEGEDADRPFRLKARPEPPLAADPAPGAVQFGGRVAFSWTLSDEADHYRLQVARDPGFGDRVEDRDRVFGAEAALEGLAPGRYHWRLRSVRADGDAGPWGPTRSFEVRPPPPAPPAPTVGDHTVRFSWNAQPGQQFDFQLARDAAFGERLVEQRLAQPEIELPRPAPGEYHVRLRAIETDGFVGPWGAVQRFEVLACVRDGANACVRTGDGPLRRPR